MKILKNQLIHELCSNGITIIPSHFNTDFCQKAKQEIDTIIQSNQNYVLNVRSEGTSGDERVYKIENQSKTASEFKDDPFINSIIQEYHSQKVCSHFIIGGKVMAQRGKTTNSGGGWHRDADRIQLKAMVYLSDVGSINGPFIFLKESGNFDLERRPNLLKKENFYQRIRKLLSKKTPLAPPRYDDAVIEKVLKEGRRAIEVTGKAGDVVLFDSSFIHRGKNIEEGVRYTLTNYYYADNFKERFSRRRQFKKYFIPTKVKSKL